LVKHQINATLGETEVFTYDRDSLIYFRDHEFNRYRGALRWWEHIRNNKAQLVSLMLKDAPTRALTLELFMSAQKLAKSPDQKIPDEDIDKAIYIVDALRKSKNRVRSPLL
jgi:hypothetical protein